MNAQICWPRATMLLVGAIVLALTVAASAQVQSNSSTKAGTPTVTTSVERGEVVHVTGNDVVVRMQDGSIRDFPDVPESARITVDGKEIGVHDLKPGMKLEKTITTTTTPKMVTTVQTVTGTIWHVRPPTTVILRLEDGTNETFTIPKGQKFNVNGQMVDAFGLQKGMKISATKVVEAPETSIHEQAKVTGQMPTPAPVAAAPPPPPPDVPIIIAQITVPATPAAPAAPAPQSELPKTGSPLPLIGLLGLLLLTSSITLKAIRRDVR